ncbi:MAG: hydroxyacid dehydrogenase [Candidatus Bathyarchaeia archaeon]
MRSDFTVLLVEEIDEAGLKILMDNVKVVFASGYSEEVLLKETENVDAIIIRVMGKITRKIVENAKKLKVIGRHGAGLDNVDLKAITEHKIPLVYTPDANAESVADHTIGLMIAVAKKIPQAHYAVKFEKNWSVRYKYIGAEVYKKTLGLIGLGTIGRSVAKRAKGFDMRILYNSRTRKPDMEKELGVEYADLETLLKNSDFVSIHVPLTEKTYKMIGDREIGKMKDGSFLINTSRGGIVDEAALYRALVSGKLAGAALDVYEKEPPDFENPLFKLENVVLSPHMAAHTKEALRRMAVTVAEDVIAVLNGKRPKYLANPEVLGRCKPAETI